MLEALLSNGDVNKNLLHPLPLIKWCISPSLFCTTAKTHVCKHILYAMHTVVLQVLSQPSTWLILTTLHFKHHWSLQWARDILPCEDSSFAVSCEQRQALKQHSPRMESAFFFFCPEHLPPVQTSARTFWGWEEVGVAYEICTSNYSFQIYGNDWFCCIWLWKHQKKTHSLKTWKVKKGSLPVNKLLKKEKCQTTEVQKNDFEYARQAGEYNMLSQQQFFRIG